MEGDMANLKTAWLCLTNMAYMPQSKLKLALGWYFETRIPKPSWSLYTVLYDKYMKKLCVGEQNKKCFLYAIQALLFYT